MASIYKEAGRQGILLRSVKSIFLQIELSYRYEIWYDVFYCIWLLSISISRESVQKRERYSENTKVDFFYAPFSTGTAEPLLLTLHVVYSLCPQ